MLGTTVLFLYLFKSLLRQVSDFGRKRKNTVKEESSFKQSNKPNNDSKIDGQVSNSSQIDFSDQEVITVAYLTILYFFEFRIEDTGAILYKIELS